MLAVSRTASFRRLQSRIGSSTYRLNTILVGLECVAAGTAESGSIAVTWTKPKPEKAKEVADQARIFACSGALTMTFDVIDNYIKGLANEKWLCFSEQTRRIASKAVPRKSSDGGDYSVAERVESLFEELGATEPVLIAALELLAKWRNVVVHSDDRTPRLTEVSDKSLRAAAKELSEKYANFRVALAIDNYRRRKTPVPKEVTSLTAMAVNLCRALDQSAITRVAGDARGAEKSAFLMLESYFSVSAERAQKPWPELSEIWQGDVARREKQLIKLLAALGFSDGKGPISAPLPDQFVNDLATLSKDQFANRFKIKKDS